MASLTCLSYSGFEVQHLNKFPTIIHKGSLDLSSRSNQESSRRKIRFVQILLVGFGHSRMEPNKAKTYNLLHPQLCACSTEQHAIKKWDLKQRKLSLKYEDFLMKIGRHLTRIWIANNRLASYENTTMTYLRTKAQSSML